jgi:SPP1 gp7 family putative phage head morphogenesis protein
MRAESRKNYYETLNKAIRELYGIENGKLKIEKGQRVITAENGGGLDNGGASIGAASIGGASIGGVNIGAASIGGANIGAASIGGADNGGASIGGASIGAASIGAASIAALQWDDDGFDFDDGIFEEAARELLNAGGYSPEMLADNEACRNLIKETFRVLDSGVSKGLGTKPDPDLAAALRENVFVFSGFKTHAELEQAAQLITDEKGVLKPFNQFLNDAKTINAEYNHNYLRSEYNQAVQSAQIAAKWHDVQSRKDLVNLQYRTANDERVRAEHRRLHGVTLPVDDPFWEQFTPPLGWNCRCTIVEVLKDDYPESDSQGSIATATQITDKPKDKIFRFNPGIEKAVFPKKHPYLPKGCGECGKGVGSKKLAYNPNSVWCQACKAIAICKNGALGEQGISPADKDKIYNMPLKQQYDEISTANGSTVYQHKLTCTHDEDYIRVKDAASAFADNYYSVRINPEINPKAQTGRRKIYPDMNEDFKGNPDLSIKNYGYIDVKSPESPSKCVHWANFASSKQNAAVCLTNYRMTITEAQIEHKNEEIWRSPLYRHNIIFWIINGRLRKYERPE